MKNLLLSSTILIAAFGTSALAQSAGFQGGELALSYTGIDNDNLDNPISNFSGNFATAYNISPAIGIQLGAGYNSFSLEEGDTAYSIDMTDINAHAYYNFGENGKAGLFVARYSLSDLSLEQIGGPGTAVIPISSDLLTYGIEGRMNYGALNIELRYGMADVQNSLILDAIDSSLLDISFVTAEAGYAVSPKLEITANLANTRVAYDGDSIELFAYGIGAEYEVITSLKVVAGINGGKLSSSLGPETIDMFGYSLGAEYELAAGGIGDNGVTLFASFGSTNISGFGGIDEDLKTYSIGASIPFGGGSDDLYSRIQLF